MSLCQTEILTRCKYILNEPVDIAINACNIFRVGAVDDLYRYLKIKNIENGIRVKNTQGNKHEI